MSQQSLEPYDIVSKAENGLRRGITTGTCAAAAVKAALLLLEFETHVTTVAIALPDGAHFLNVDISSVERLNENASQASVIKYAGDDPDNTDGATITARIERNELGMVRFLAGPGVGTVTAAGIRVPVGEPAINPKPREMILLAINETVDETKNHGYDVTIGCLNGEEIAKRTFNPRLGIVGGISILGTTGIVEPMSLAAYKAAIEVYIRVALAGPPSHAAFLPGNVGLGFAAKQLNLTQKQIVHTSNFVGFSLDSAQEVLVEEQAQLPNLWLLGHPGKLAKLLDFSWDTHSKNSPMAMHAVSRIAAEIGFSKEEVDLIASANTVEAIVEMLENKPSSVKLWSEIEARIALLAHAKVPNVAHFHVRLFSMNGTPIGRAA
jgi:cobalt-precorrin-5B (C1)-methyltransferase